MKAIIDTGDYKLRTIGIKEVKSELLNEFGAVEITVILDDNSDKLTKCCYRGFGGDKVLDELKSGSLNIDIAEWDIYRKYEAEVQYEIYKSLSEYKDIAGLLGKNKEERQKKDDKEQWEKLDRLK